jgi:hypothetical protein
MKKILLYAITMVFVLSLGVAYADAGNNFGSNKTIINNNYDIGPADVPATSMEGVNAGGLRSTEPGMVLSNGITDFTGRSYDTLSDIGIASPDASRVSSVEGSHAGGLRTAGSGNRAFNGITDFTGRSYDVL